MALNFSYGDQDTDHKHDRFLYCENGFMIFGCINPFCCHGELGLPNHQKVPLETGAVKIKVTHIKRKVKFELTLKKAIGDYKIEDVVVFETDDNLVASKNRFQDFFAEGK